MTLNPDAHSPSHPRMGRNAVYLQVSGSTYFTKDDSDMFHIEFREAEAEERQARFRAEAEIRRRWQTTRRPFRRRAGETIVRFGRQVGGEATSDPLPDALTN